MESIVFKHEEEIIADAMGLDRERVESLPMTLLGVLKNTKGDKATMLIEEVLNEFSRPELAIIVTSMVLEKISNTQQNAPAREYREDFENEREEA